jgi:Asp/Glu/hydantoin racemase
LTPLFTDLCQLHLPEASIFHMVDESLIQDTVRAGYLRKVTIRRVAALVDSAVEAGADAVLVTCSSIGVAVERAAERHDVPVLRVDEAMAIKGVNQARTIGVLATLRTTLEPTSDLLRRKAAEAGRDVKLVECLCEEAFPAVMAGDTETHDRLLRKALTEDLKDVDTIVLAQASMARVVASLPEGALKAEVLSSPELGVLSVRQALGL